MHPGTSISQVYLCCVPVDFRKQIDGLAALVEAELALNVFSDALFGTRSIYRCASPDRNAAW